MFITDETEPPRSPAMSSGIAQDTLTVNSMPSNAVTKPWRHSVGYSLGFEGQTEHLPNEDVLKLATMCEHGMVSALFAKKMVDWVIEGVPHTGRGGGLHFVPAGLQSDAR